MVASFGEQTLPVALAIRRGIQKGEPEKVPLSSVFLIAFPSSSIEYCSDQLIQQATLTQWLSPVCHPPFVELRRPRAEFSHRLTPHLLVNPFGCCEMPMRISQAAKEKLLLGVRYNLTRVDVPCEMLQNYRVRPHNLLS